MTVGQVVCGAGILISLLGFAIEAVAFAAMGSYRLRRALPFHSPLQLQSLGCYAVGGSHRQRSRD